MSDQRKSTQQDAADLRSELPSSEEAASHAVLRGAGGSLLRALALGPKSVGELVAATGLSQPNVSNHLARLRERGLVRGRREGRQVIYQLRTAALGQLVLLNSESSTPPGVTLRELEEEFLAAVLSLEEPAAARVVDLALAAGFDWKSLYLRVFVPTLRRVGELWEKGELPVAAEHVISGLTLRMLHRLSLTLPGSSDCSAPTAVVACVEGELHTLGGRIVADFLLAQGWRAWYLNGYLPLEHLLEAAERHRPDAVVLCISTGMCAAALTASVAQLQRLRGTASRPLIVAGGRYFESHSGGSLGADLWGTDVEEVTRAMRERLGDAAAANR